MTDRFQTLDEVYKRADAVGLIVDEFKLDGDWHRVPVVGKKKQNLSGAYCLSELSLQSGRVAIVGMLYNWVNGIEERLTLDGVEGATAEEIAEAKRRAKAAAEKSKREKAQLQAETAERAQGIWDKLPDSGRSQYLQKKGVKAWGLRFSRGSVVVPARDISGKISTLQFIDPDGNKRFLTGGAKRGRFHLIGRLPPEGQPLLIGIAEGYATAATLHEALSYSIAVAFDAGNIIAVAQAFRRAYPNMRIVIFSDHDRFNGYPQAFIKQSQANDAVRHQIKRLQQIRPDVEIEIVADDDPRLKDNNKSHNAGVAAAILTAAAVRGDVIVPKFREAV